MDSKDYYETYWEYREDTDHLYDEWIPPRATIARDIILGRRPKTIIDVGCGQGVLGGQLRESNYKPDVLCGCDISEKALAHASDYYDELELVNVEEESLDCFSECEFECIVCLETLEHLFDPNAALNTISEHLTGDGVLIASFPNFVHYRHRLDMLRGRVPEDYTLTGDGAEHIQNFTIESFTSLLDEVGFTVRETHPVYNTPFGVPEAAGVSLSRLFSQQYVLVATPTKPP